MQIFKTCFFPTHKHTSNKADLITDLKWHASQLNNWLLFTQIMLSHWYITVWWILVIMKTPAHMAQWFPNEYFYLCKKVLTVNITATIVNRLLSCCLDDTFTVVAITAWHSNVLEEEDLLYLNTHKLGNFCNTCNKTIFLLILKD